MMATDSDRLERYRDRLTDGRLHALAFFGLTSLLFLQHSLGWNWDFAVYSMTGEYLFHDGSYIEWARAPLAPTIMGLFQFIVSRRLAEFGYILLSSGLFFHATKRLSGTYGIRRSVLFTFLLSPFFIFEATRTGTELLALSLLTLFMADLDRSRAGIWLGLALVTRYTTIWFTPLLLFQQDVRKMIRTGVVATVPMTAWFLYNHHIFGDPFTSLANSYALNVGLRTISDPFHITHPLLMAGTSLAFITGYLIHRRTLPSMDRRDMAMAGFGILALLSYAMTPVKPLRYLFLISLPAAYFAAYFWDRVDLRSSWIHLLLIVQLAGGFFVIAAKPPAHPSTFEDVQVHADGCQTASNIWPLVSYAGTPTEPVSGPELTREQIDRGYRVLLFRHVPTPQFMQDEDIMDNMSVILETPGLYVLGNRSRCLPAKPMNRTYFELRDERLQARGIQENYESCTFLFGRYCPLDHL